MVDTLGGIDVESDIAFTTGEESGLVVEVKEGTNHFNGQEALAFCVNVTRLRREIIREERTRRRF